MNQIIFGLSVLSILAAAPVSATDGRRHIMPGGMMASGLFIPEMNAKRGRELFASKGCVVCHSINGIGGEVAPMLDAEFMDEIMNPFDFAARMWRGGGAMIARQQTELGKQIDLTGQELADIIAFVHNAEEQARFSEFDVPHEIEEMMQGAVEEDHDE